MMSSTKDDLEQEERNWLDLPNDVMINILNRVGMVDIIENAEKVCTAWLKICKEPVLWRVVNMNDLLMSSVSNYSVSNIFRLAVSRSQGQLVDVTLADDLCATLLCYVSKRSSRLRRLEIVNGYIVSCLSDVLVKFSLLEELSLYFTKITKEDIETIGRCCPMLKTLKVNDIQSEMPNDKIATAIGKKLPELRHLELIGMAITNNGLQMILDNCLYLETLDLRGCDIIYLKGKVGKQCSEQIKYLKLPNDSPEGFPYLDSLCYKSVDGGYDYYLDSFDVFDDYADQYG